MALTLAALAIASTGAAYFDAAEIKVTGFTVCDERGKAGLPHVGDPYYFVRADWVVERPSPKPYRVRFQMAGQTAFIDEPNPRKGFFSRMCAFYMPLDGPIEAKVTVDPEGASGDPDLSRRRSSTTF